MQCRVADGECLRSPLWKWAFALPSLLFKCWFVLVFAISLLVLYVPFRVLLRKPAHYPAAFRLMRAWGRFLSVAGMVPLRRTGEPRLPAPPYVACFNHTSYLDIVHAFRLMPDYFLFMGKHDPGLALVQHFLPRHAHRGEPRQRPRGCPCPVEGRPGH